MPKKKMLYKMAGKEMPDLDEMMKVKSKKKKSIKKK